uniref:CUB domain-containing protein n=1 Tax=Panagrellus redivivus TaxID=6233 RepID=A0A7E4V0C7_PANRE
MLSGLVVVVVVMFCEPTNPMAMGKKGWFSVFPAPCAVLRGLYPLQVMSPASHDRSNAICRWAYIINPSLEQTSLPPYSPSEPSAINRPPTLCHNTWKAVVVVAAAAAGRPGLRQPRRQRQAAANQPGPPFPPRTFPFPSFSSSSFSALVVVFAMVSSVVVVRRRRFESSQSPQSMWPKSI